MRVTNGTITAAAVLLVGTFGARAQVVQTPLDPTSSPQVVDPLPLLGPAGGTVATVFGNRPLTLRMSCLRCCARWMTWVSS